MGVFVYFWGFLNRISWENLLCIIGLPQFDMFLKAQYPVVQQTTGLMCFEPKIYLTQGGAIILTN